MGIRTAFNPLGALPYASGYTVSWTIDNIPLLNGSYVVPSSWIIDDGTDSATTVYSSDSNLVMGTATADSQNEGFYVVPFTYTFTTGSDSGSHTVRTDDGNFDDGTNN